MQQLDLQSLLEINEDKYKNYLEQYLKVPNSPDIPLWEIFTKYIKSKQTEINDLIKKSNDKIEPIRLDVNTKLEEFGKLKIEVMNTSLNEFNTLMKKIDKLPLNEFNNKDVQNINIGDGGIFSHCPLVFTLGGKTLAVNDSCHPSHV